MTAGSYEEDWYTVGSSEYISSAMSKEFQPKIPGNHYARVMTTVALHHEESHTHKHVESPVQCSNTGRRKSEALRGKDKMTPQVASQGPVSRSFLVPRAARACRIFVWDGICLMEELLIVEVSARQD